MDRSLGTLIRTSLTDPQAVARELMAMNLGRDALWTGLGLIAVINTFLILLVLQIAPPTVELPSYFDRPLVLFVLIAGLTVVFVHAMYWAGLSVGGQGSLMDVLAIVVWIQVLRAMAQVAVLVLSLALPPLGALLSLVVAAWGLWIFLNLLTAALNLPSLWRAAAVLLIAGVGLVLGLGLLLGLIGGLARGVMS